MTLRHRDSSEGFCSLVLWAGPAGSETGDSSDVPEVVIADAKAVGSLEVKLTFVRELQAGCHPPPHDRCLCGKDCP